MNSDEHKVDWVYWSPSEQEESNEKIDLEKVNKMIYEVSPMPIKGLIKAYGLKGRMEYETKELIKKTPMYKMGHYDGKKEGVSQTSKRFEDKLKSQARHFEDQKTSLEKNVEDLKNLLIEYEEYMQEKEDELEKSLKEQIKELEEIKFKYEEFLSKYKNCLLIKNN